MDTQPVPLGQRLSPVGDMFLYEITVIVLWNETRMRSLSLSIFSSVCGWMRAWALWGRTQRASIASGVSHDVKMSFTRSHIMLHKSVYKCIMWWNMRHFSVLQMKLCASSSTQSASHNNSTYNFSLGRRASRSSRSFGIWCRLDNSTFEWIFQWYITQTAAVRGQRRQQHHELSATEVRH